MPVYEYQCPQCNAVFELWRNISDTGTGNCPACSVPMQKLISKSTFQLRGSGWYADGYCRKKGTDEQKRPSAACGNGEKTCETCC